MQMGADQVSKESKLLITKDIVSSYVKERENLNADEVCELIRKVYQTVDQIAPEPEPRRVGLA